MRPSLSPPPDRHDRLRRAAALALAACVLLPLGERLVAAPFDYSLWSDRDLLRSALVHVERPVGSAELGLTAGARLPGAALYHLWAPVVALTPDPAHVYRLGALLDLLGCALLGAFVGRRAGAWAGALAAALYVATPAVVETLLRLWNPGFVPLFAVLQAICAWQVVVDRKPLALVGLAVATSLAAQMHLEGLLLGAGLLAGILAARPPGLLRALPLAALAFAAGYLPWLVRDALEGWPVLSEVLRHGPSAARPWRLGELARGLARQLTPGAPYAPSLGWTALLWLGALPALAAAARGGGDAARGARVLAAGVLAFPLFHAVDARVGFTSTWSGRYLVAAIPALAALTAGGWAALVARLDARARPAATALVLALAAAAAAPSLSLARWLPRPSPEAWTFQRDVLDAVRAETGWSLREVAGRTSLWTSADGRAWTFKAEQGIAYLLHLEGEAWPGSLAPPCAVVLYRGERELTGPADEALLRATLAQDLGGLTVLRRAPLPHDSTLLLYDAAGGRCPTTFAQRYVPLPDEAPIARHWLTLPATSAAEVPAPPGIRRAVGRLDVAGADPIGLSLDVAVDDGLVVTLHAPQLRGHAYNSWLLSVAMLGDVRVTLTGSDGRVLTAALAPDLVGHAGVFTPLSGRLPVPAGAWDVALEAEVIPLPAPTWPLAELRRVPVRLDLLEGVVVPDGAPGALTP